VLGYINNEARRLHTSGTESNIFEVAPKQSNGTVLVVKTTQLSRLLVVLLFEKYLTIRNGSQVRRSCGQVKYQP
jgi:hypothetical protein